MQFHAYVATKQNHPVTLEELNSPRVARWFWCLWQCISKKVFHNTFKCQTSIILSSVIFLMKCSFLMSFWNCGPSNTLTFIFSNDKLGNTKIRYLKKSSSIDKALTNCFWDPISYAEVVI